MRIKILDLGNVQTKKSFTLIELILVVVLIGIVSFLFIFIPKLSTKPLEVDKLRKFLKPSGEIIIFNDGSNLVILKDKNITNVKLNFIPLKVYLYDGNEFIEKNFPMFNDKEVIFDYKVKSGIGESFILETEKYFYVFKPLWIQKVKSFDEAENLYLLKNLYPEDIK